MTNEKQTNPADEKNRNGESLNDGNNGFRWCKAVSGTLAYRDGFKTGPSTPNGQDAADGKLVVW